MRARAHPLEHNCSGKHAGMLALCRVNGWASRGYRLATHPVSTRAGTRSPRRGRSPAEEMPTAVDGCGVVTFALPLERMALMFSRLEQVEGGARVAAAMRAHPELIRGPIAADSLLMRELEGWTAKGGAEASSVRPGRTASGSRSKSRTGACGRCGPRWLSCCCAGSGSRPASWAPSRSRTPAGSSSARWWRAVKRRLKFGYHEPRGPLWDRARWSEPASPRSGSLFLSVAPCPRQPRGKRVHAYRRHRPA